MLGQCRIIFFAHDTKHFLSTESVIRIKHSVMHSRKTRFLHCSFQIVVDLRERENVEYREIHAKFAHGIPDLLLFDLEDLLRIILAGSVSPSFIFQICQGGFHILRRDHGIHITVTQEMCLKDSYSCYRIGIIPI